MTGDQSEWFDDVPAWPAGQGAPAHQLARDLASARLVGAGAPVAQSVSPEPMSFAPEQSYRSDSPADSVDDYPDTEYQPTASDDGDPFELMRVRSAKTKTKDGAPSFVRKHRTALIGTAATVVGLVVVSAVAIGLLTGQSGDDSTTTQADAVASSPADVSDPAAVADACPSLSDGAVTTGNDAGDQKTGPGAIKAFNWGYYVERSARAAREVAAPNAVAREGVLQTFIDQVPEGSTHCLSITDEGNGTYAVVLTEIPPDPDAAPIVYPQIIKTIRTDGKVFIASITSEE